MHKPNFIDSKIIFDFPAQSLFTNAVVDAIDSTTTSTSVFPFAYTATLSSRYDEHNFRSLATDVDLAAVSRLSFGLFLADDTPDKINVMYSCKSAIKFIGEIAAPIMCYPIFGRCNAAVVTSSTIAASNELANYIILPDSSNSSISNVTTASQGYVRQACNQDIIKVGNGGTGFPMFFGWVIENLSAGTAYNIDYLSCSVSFQKYVGVLDVYHPDGH